MYLYLSDKARGNPLIAREPVEKDFQAEQWVLDHAGGLEVRFTRPILVFLLCDEQGLRCVWWRTLAQAQANKQPVITRVTTRFTSGNKLLLAPVPRLHPRRLYEQKALEHYRYYP